jgi:hypothetical protein
LDLRETAQLLAVASSIDNRIVDEMTVGAWHESIGFLPYADCREALAMHRRESSEYLQPAHISVNVKRVWAERRKSEPVIAARVTTQDASRPANYAAMSAAWNDPAAFAREVDVYRDQLRAEGYQGRYP